MRFAVIGVLLAAVLSAGQSTPGSEAAIARHYRPADQESQRYAYVPVDVPPGATRLTITYAYEARGGDNAIDLGLIEPGPLALRSSALRGWSGGSRDRITIGVDEASPGYWPGPLPSGQWHIVLGLYKVASGGVDVRIATEISSQPARPHEVVPRRQTSPLRTGPAWYVGVTHAHTTESDGALTTTELIEKARSEGLDFLAITDHNNTTHQLFPLDRPGLLVITGEEVTTPAGHFNAWGLGGPRDGVEFRIPAGDPALSSVTAAAQRRGAVISINHPVTDCLACTWTHAIPESVEALEIANGTPSGRQQAMAIWDMLLRSGRRVTGVEGRDWHRGPERLGSPALRVWAADLSTASILDAVRRGRTVVMADGGLPVPELVVESGGRTARIGDTLSIDRVHPLHVDVTTPDAYRGGRVDWVWNGEVVASIPVADGHTRFERAPSASGYARVHLVAADGRPLAITNPVFLTVR